MQAGVCLCELVNKSKGVRLDRKMIELTMKVVSTLVQVHFVMSPKVRVKNLTFGGYLYVEKIFS